MRIGDNTERNGRQEGTERGGSATIQRRGQAEAIQIKRIKGGEDWRQYRGTAGAIQM